jgi:hypothetical protein
MNRLLWAPVLVLGLVVATASAQAFDCAKAYLPVDFVICSDPAVMKANEAHEKAWYDTRARLSDVEKQQLLADQRRWLKDFPPKCGVPARGKRPPMISRDQQLCVERALEERQAFLVQYYDSSSPTNALNEAQVTPDLQQKIDTMVRLCIAGGRQFTVTGGGSGGAEISLRTLDVNGNLKGDFHVSKSQAEGLANGIDNAISQVAANEADKVRECLKPVRDRLLNILFPSPATPSPPSSTSEQPRIPESSPGQQKDVLYDTRIDKDGFGSWPLPPDWKLLNNKTLVSDGTAPLNKFAPIFAPYTPENADYSVEATIRLVQDFRNGYSFGIVVRANGQDGYAVGVGRGWGGTHVCYLTGMWTVNAIRDCKGQGLDFKPDSRWHIYRAEAKGNMITLSIDKAVYTSLTDNRFLSPGHVGLWSGGYQLEVRDFKVLQLSPQ